MGRVGVGDVRKMRGQRGRRREASLGRRCESWGRGRIFWKVRA